MKELIKYLESLTVTQGQGLNEPLTLLPWEKRFVKGAFGTTGDAGLSVGRGNGKTTLIAGIAAAAVDPDGPLCAPRAETVIVASSFDQGRIDFDHVIAFLETRGYDLADRKAWKIQNSVNKAAITNLENKATVKCIGSDPKRAHGLAPKLIIADEPAQWPGTTTDQMHAALKTSLGKIPNSRMIALGTRPALAEHWFQKMLDGGAAYAQSHAARLNDPPFQLSTWKRANPSLSHMPHLLARIRLEAADAKKDPELLPQFKALRLNLGVADTVIQSLIDPDTWRKLEGNTEQAGDYALGLDLGTSAAMSAAACYFPDTGYFDGLACFGSNPSLSERGLRDGVGKRYVDMAARNELIVSDGRVSDLSVLLGAALERWGSPAAIICDRWRADELLDTLEQMNFPLCDLIVRGMGFLHGGEDVRDFRRAVLSGYVTPAQSLLMRSALSEARVVMDPAGNTKLAKNVEGGRRLRARDDAAAAGVLAIAAGYRRLRELGKAA